MCVCSKDDVIMPKTHLDLPDGTEVEIDVDVPDTEKQKRTFGSARGKIQIMDDFDEPLPQFRW
jgi:hypothetical protein